MVKAKTNVLVRTGYHVPVLDAEGNFIGTKVIEGDPQVGNGSRGSRNCIPRDGKVAVGRKKKWGRK